MSDSIHLIYDKKSKHQYQRGKFLGKGGFAKCYELRQIDPVDISKTIYAVKVIEKSSLQKKIHVEKLVSEVTIHKKIHHINVVNFVKAFEDRARVYIVLEMCSNNSLMELVGRQRGYLTELETSHYINQLVEGLVYLKHNRIIHRDLKLGNIFLDSSLRVKIGDFGLAAKLEEGEESRMTTCGTPNYIAPEMLGKVGHSYAVDVWALGVITFTLLTGKPPFESRDLKSTYKRIRSLSYDWPATNPVSAEARDFVASTLILQPLLRPSIEKLSQHPFLAKFQRYHQYDLPLWTRRYVPLLDSKGNLIQGPLSAKLSKKLRQKNKKQLNFHNENLAIPGIVDANEENNVYAKNGINAHKRKKQPKTNILGDKNGKKLPNVGICAPTVNRNLRNGNGINLNPNPMPRHSVDGPPIIPQILDNQPSDQPILDQIYENAKHSTDTDDSTTSTSSGTASKNSVVPSLSPSTTSSPQFPTPGRLFLSSIFRIKHWINMQKRYGLGYCLTNGSFGVLFIDNSSITTLSIPNKSGEHRYYTQYFENLKESRNPLYFYMDSVPAKLKKKANILRAMKLYIHKNAAPCTEEVANEMPGKIVEVDPSITEPTLLQQGFVPPLSLSKMQLYLDSLVPIKETSKPNDSMICSGKTETLVNFEGRDYSTSLIPFVKRYSLSKQGVTFQLSNMTIQVNFFNHHKILINNVVKDISPPQTSSSSSSKDLYIPKGSTILTHITPGDESITQHLLSETNQYSSTVYFDSPNKGSPLDFFDILDEAIECSKQLRKMQMMNKYHG